MLVSDGCTEVWRANNGSVGTEFGRGTSAETGPHSLLSDANPKASSRSFDHSFKSRIQKAAPIASLLHTANTDFPQRDTLILDESRSREEIITFIKMVTISIDGNYGYVLAAAVSTLVVGAWHGMRVGGFRKAAKIPYPFEYASYEQVQSASPASAKAMILFNSAQRAHQNFNENHATALTAMLIAGLKYPVAAAVLGAMWSVNRVVYAIGYTNGQEGGKGRYYGVLWMIAHHVLIGYAGKTAYDISMS